MKMKPKYTFIKGESPVVISAIHDGHDVREELEHLYAIDETSRLREEDPFTATWTYHSDSRIIVHQSRFEVDINRPREKAVYQKPEDAWGLQVWKKPLPQEELEKSLAVYDEFYASAKQYFDELLSIHDSIIVFDLHSYNHQREGQVADQSKNPDINIGTGNMNRELWAPVVESLIECFKCFDYDGQHLDVRENVKFKGGYFGKWLFEQYGNAVCPISIEFKKIFMDEISGKGFENQICMICSMVKLSVRDVIKELKKAIHA
jgi:N-formylglutamate amidohydrolase